MGHILIAGSRGYPAKYGGFETLAHKLAEIWSAQNIHTVITGFAKDGTKPIQVGNYRDGLIKSVTVTIPVWSRLKNLVSTLLAVIYAVRKFEITCALVLNDVNFLSALYLRSRGIKTIIHLDGDESARRGLPRLGRLMHVLFRRMSFKFLDDLVIDSFALLRTVPRWSESNIRVIKYGVDPNDIYKSDIPFSADWMAHPYILTVARLVPENNIKEILGAYMKSNCKIPLVIIGKGTGKLRYEKELESLRMVEKDRVFILPAMYDSKLIHYLMSKCTLYVHGHEAGGTNPVLVSARFYARKICSHDNIYNRECARVDEIFWHDNQDLKSNFDELEDVLANSGRDLVQESGLENWNSIGKQYLELLLSK